jgi:hypothetical protein
MKDVTGMIASTTSSSSNNNNNNNNNNSSNASKYTATSTDFSRPAVTQLTPAISTDWLTG